MFYIMSSTYPVLEYAVDCYLLRRDMLICATQLTLQ